jgi:hypothetical protein
MDMRRLAQKLRRAAEALEELMGTDRQTTNEDGKTATAIKKELAISRGLHWTQTTAGKAKLSRQSRKAWAARRRAAA